MPRRTKVTFQTSWGRVSFFKPDRPNKVSKLALVRVTKNREDDPRIADYDKLEKTHKCHVPLGYGCEIKRQTFNKQCPNKGSNSQSKERKYHLR